MHDMGEGAIAGKDLRCRKHKRAIPQLFAIRQLTV